MDQETAERSLPLMFATVDQLYNGDYHHSDFHYSVGGTLRVMAEDDPYHYKAKNVPEKDVADPRVNSIPELLRRSDFQFHSQYGNEDVMTLQVWRHKKAPAWWLKIDDRQSVCLVHVSGWVQFLDAMKNYMPIFDIYFD